MGAMVKQEDVIDEAGENTTFLTDDLDRSIRISRINDETQTNKRGSWDNKIEFLFSCLSFAVGLGNVWRFPYLCYRNGGGAFLIPYTLNLIFTGLPLFYFELSLGQYAKSSPIALWSICPLFKGVGYSMLLIVTGIGLYYNVIVSWILYYLGATIYSIGTGTVPWGSCGNSWNTENCSQSLEHFSAENVTSSLEAGEGSLFGGQSSNATSQAGRTSPPEEYFERQVLQLHLSPGIDQLYGMRWELCGCLLAAWLIVYCTLLKGVKSLGKAVYFTALFPYFILLLLLVKGLTLPGAMDGIYFYIRPDFDKLWEIQVWADAAMQIFFSLGPCWGSLITLSSYNKFNNNTFRDAVFVATANCLTSFFAGFVVFSFLGFMSHSLKTDIQSVTVSGPGLAFVVYPEAISLLPISPLWSMLFFLMLLTLGLGTQFSIMETITRTVCDTWDVKHRTVLSASCLLMFLGGLVMTTNGGMYILTMLDNHTGTFPALVTGMVEVLVVSWIYTSQRFIEDIRRMVGWSKDSWWYKPFSLYWNGMWRIVTPSLLAIILVASAIGYKPLKLGDYEYPMWANCVAWAISGLSMACIPLLVIISLWSEGGNLVPRMSVVVSDWRKLIAPLPSWGKAEREFVQQRQTEMELLRV